jgi:hypothetical protein
LALAPLRQSPATAAWERTILKEVLSWASPGKTGTLK